jgi:hypothetical protein
MTTLDIFGGHTRVARFARPTKYPAVNIMKK